MKVWLKAGVIIFYVLGYCFLRKRMRRDIVKLFKGVLIVVCLQMTPIRHLHMNCRKIIMRI